MYWNNYFFNNRESIDFVKFERFFYLAHILAAFIIGVPWKFVERHSELLYSPNILFGILGVRKYNEFFFDAASGVFICCLILSAIGIFSKVAKITAAIVSIYFYGMKYNYSDLLQIDGHLTVSLFIVAAANFGQVRSHQEWAVRLLRLYFVFIFFSAGLLKLRLNVSDWLMENAVGRALIMSESSFVYKFRSLPVWFPFFEKIRRLIMENELIGRFLSITTVLLELSAPLALTQKGKTIVFGILMSFLAGVFCLMGHGFVFSMLPLAISFVDFKERGTI